MEMAILSILGKMTNEWVFIKLLIQFLTKVTFFGNVYLTLCQM